jgi:hypothetical protein
MNYHVGEAQVEPAAVSALIPGDIPSMPLVVVGHTDDKSLAGPFTSDQTETINTFASLPDVHNLYLCLSKKSQKKRNVYILLRRYLPIDLDLMAKRNIF